MSCILLFWGGKKDFRVVIYYRNCVVDNEGCILTSVLYKYGYPYYYWVERSKRSLDHVNDVFISNSFEFPLYVL